MEADLDQVAQVRRSLLRPQAQEDRGQRNARAKKGWLAYQSVFPSSSESEASESDKETEADSEDERFGMMGQSRRRSHPADSLSLVPQLPTASETLEEPLLGPDEITHMTTKVPVRLQVYHGRFGHWEREGLRKYKGEYRDNTQSWTSADLPQTQVSWLFGCRQYSQFCLGCCLSGVLQMYVF